MTGSSCAASAEIKFMRRRKEMNARDLFADVDAFMAAATAEFYNKGPFF
jgi:hypothetical protein